MMVSIIIPTYNRKQFIADTVKSCLEQSHSNIEVIIVDDGSTDETDLYIKQLIKTKWKDKPISYYQRDNAGASAARNFGLLKAKGEFVQFLDSDDLLFKDKLKLQLNSFDEQTEVCSCYGKLGKNKTQSITIGKQCESPIEYIQTLCSKEVHIMQTSAPLWRKYFLDSQEGWNININLGDDLEYHIRLLTKVNHIGFVDKELFWVKEHSGERLSVVNNNFEKIQSTFETKKLIYQTLINNNFFQSNIKKNFLQSIQPLYINFLQMGNNNNIIEFEKWVEKVAKKSSYKTFYLLIFTLRRIIGTRLILKIHQCKMKLNA